MAKKGELNTVVAKEAPVQTGFPRVDFKDDEYDVLVEQKGLNVILEKAIKCPCKAEGGDAMPSCKNCGGTGWIFINPISMKMVMTSLSNKTKMSEWSDENVGTVMLTARNGVKIAWMDRITVDDAYSTHSEVLHLKLYNNELFSFIPYKPEEVEDVFFFASPDKPLLRLDPSDYEIDGYVFKLNKRLSYDDVSNIAIRYRHKIQYHAIDITREARNTYVIDDVGFDKKTLMPVSAIARRAHYVLDMPGFNGSKLFDNSYTEANATCG